MQDWENAGFGVYVHWPFCQHKCPYCDFNSHVRRDIDQAKWRAALLADIQKSAAELPGRVVNSVFFGGGTPSLMPPEMVAVVIEEIGNVWTLAPDAEITLEANPTSVEAGKFAGFSAAGVNRISMGVQSLHDDDLRALGRMHSAAEARAAFDIARRHFDRVSFDLIYARQNQSLPAWESELAEAIAMAVDHFSLYQLTIESGTRFGELYDRGKLRGLPADDQAADMYLRTNAICAEAGLNAYEISNYARTGAESRHNLIYWRYGDYVGIGPGAHGRVTTSTGKFATESFSNPDQWLKSVSMAGWGRKSAEIVSPQEQAAEYLMMSLRLAEGSDLERFGTLSGVSLNRDAITELENGGFLTLSDRKLRATAEGRPVLNAILGKLLA
ncbi:MAG TPA: radical SAM family heme chaperone HemW [Paracoccaceae bacterium]|nr:radical SAM family heme chaperone HemW [Paracoccaceae bacterium]